MLVDDLSDFTLLQLRHEVGILRQFLAAEKAKLTRLPPHPPGANFYAARIDYKSPLGKYSYTAPTAPLVHSAHPADDTWTDKGTHRFAY